MGERMQLRRRLRQQRRAREAMLLDLGALVYELHRQGRRAPELLQQKAAELELVDGEVRELEDALAGIAPAGEPELAEEEPAAGQAQLLDDDGLDAGEWDEEELGDQEDEAPLDDDEEEHELPLDDEDERDEELDAAFEEAGREDDLHEDEGEDLGEAGYEDDLEETALDDEELADEGHEPGEGAPTVEVDALDDDPRSAGEARS